MKWIRKPRPDLKKLESESRAAQVALDISKQQLQLIIDSLPAFVSYVDKQYVFRFANKTFEKWFGQPMEIILNQPVANRFGDSIGFEKCNQALQRALSGTETKFELSFLGPNGETKHLNFEYVPDFESPGVVRGCISFVNDISEQKQIEQKLADTARDLQRSNVELEQFAYLASHDLQEPLRAVAANCQSVAQRYHDMLDADGQESLQLAIKGAQRMQQLICGLLEYCRVKHEDNTFEMVDCNEVMEEALSALAEPIAETQAKIECDKLPCIKGVPSLLGQLFQNLIGNAIKFRRGPGPNIRVTAQAQETGWQISVQDDGIGIDAKYFDRIFVIFQRLHGRDTFPGAGIGLGICRKIVELHGGRIWVESQGAGSTFHCFLPHVKGEAP